MKRIINMAIICVSLASLWVGLCSPVQADNVKKWKMSVCTNEADPMTMYAKDIAKRIKEKTQGKIDITIFDSMKLGHERETIEQMQAHALEMSIHCAGALAIFWEGLNFYSLPYLFTSMDQGAAFEASAEAQKLRDMFEEKTGIKILGYHPSFFMHIMNSKRAINKPQDLSGLKIRTMENAMQIDAINHLGATAVPMSWADLIPALQTKVVDGFYNPLPTFTAIKSWEILNHLSLVNIFYDITFVDIDSKVWKILTAEEQKLIQEAIDEALVKDREVLARVRAEGLELLEKNGVMITKPELKFFSDLVKPVHDKFYKDFPELKSIIDKAISLQ